MPPRKQNANRIETTRFGNSQNRAISCITKWLRLRYCDFGHLRHSSPGLLGIASAGTETQNLILEASASVNGAMQVSGMLSVLAAPGPAEALVKAHARRAAAAMLLA